MGFFDFIEEENALLVFGKDFPKRPGLPVRRA